MSEPRGTQIKNLPRVNTLAGSDVIVKQKTLPNNSQTQGIRVSDVMNYTRQQLSIPQILQDITDIQQQIAQIRYLGILNISNVDDDNLTFRITSPDTHIQSILNNINAQNIFRYYFDLNGLVNKKILSTQQDPNGTCWKAIFNDNFSCNVFFNYTQKYNTNDWAGLGIYLSDSLNRPKRFFYASFGKYTGLFLQDTFRQKLLIYQKYRSYTNPAGSASGSPNAVEAVNTFIYSTGLMEVKLYLSRGGNFDSQNIIHQFPIPFVNNGYNINITPGVLGAGSLAPGAGYSNVTTTSFQSNVSEANLTRMSINLSGEVDLDAVL